MTTEQIIEEILMEASEFGIREDVLKQSKKYMNEGMPKLEAIETAYSELIELKDETSYIDEEEEDDDEYENWDGIEEWDGIEDDDDTWDYPEFELDDEEEED